MSKWPSERTAILVIHGMGQQNPLETLDRLVQPLKAALEESNPDAAIRLSHGLLGTRDWPEHRISIEANGNRPPIHCFEYYWAHQTQRRIDTGEVFDWLLQTGIAAQKFYNEHPDLMRTDPRGVDSPFAPNLLTRRTEFKRLWYLKHAGLPLRLAHLVMVAGGPLISALPVLAKPVQFLARLAGIVFKPFIVDSLGDVTIYTSTDRKAEFYEIRQEILDGAVEHVEWLMGSPDYDRIVLVGHSLGSVIAYDALNRINNRMNVKLTDRKLSVKLTGLATFGSPLDKIAFFFRERAKANQLVRRQMLDHYHGFKSKGAHLGEDEIATIANEIAPLLDDHMRWWNFWDPKDPVAGHLDFYAVDQNIKMDLRLGRHKAHSGYWDSGMWKYIIEGLLVGQPGGVPTALRA